ncbi:hypothetical protein MBLNU459_g0911t1 [Dothideomycetes sp. NU459]
MYSHLLGAVFFTALVPYFYTKVDPKSTTEYEVVLVFSIYFLGVATCFVLSTMCHLLWNHSPHYAALGNQFDYLGIVVLMWGASIPTIYFGFWCDPRLQRFYWIMKKRMALDWMGTMATFNLLGATVYAARVPERWFPYRFDLFGASHQIFHIMIVIAALAHVAGILQAYHNVCGGSGICF